MNVFMRLALEATSVPPVLISISSLELRLLVSPFA